MKLFRGIRQTLLKEGKLKKYLIYAIGEILLVMIGILLAFQVNNWNSRSNNKKTEIQYYQNIKRQLNEDMQIIIGNIHYNNQYFHQYELATQIIEDNDRSKIDTLSSIAFNLIRYSDVHRKSNIYETIVNSGQIKLLNNHNIIERLQRLEETYIYINRLEDTHFEVIKLYMIPSITNTIKVVSVEAKNPDAIFDYKFQNNFVLTISLMKEKSGMYTQAFNEINGIIELIDEELKSGT